ncbi:protein FAM170A isoform X1 [Saccopteryx bilineata]|uniref:protein FAM170A isoform X1 n=1 Tax=Saccopteryx bilineata TaxID=59482 RepID=UPI0033904EFA
MKQRQKRKHLENEEPPETEEKGGGISKSQEDAPQLGSTEVAQTCGPGSGEVSSASKYFSCVSSPSKHIWGGIWGVHQDGPQPKSLAPGKEQEETAPVLQHASLSSPLSYKTCATSQCINNEERGMKIYYMQVQVKKGVAVSWETEAASEPLRKKPKMEEVNLSEDVRVDTPPSDVSTSNLLFDSEPSGEVKEPEVKGEMDSHPGSSAAEEKPRAKTPDWLVTMETGFRCLACCRVFSSLEMLKEHVQFGVREGFSCYVFHLAMAQQRSNVESEPIQEKVEEEEEEEEEAKDKDDEKQEEKKHEEEQPTG